MEISVKPMSYGHRLTKAIIEPIFLGSIIVTTRLAIYRQINSIGIFITIAAVLFLFFRRLHWYKYYLKKVNFETTQVKVEYYKYNVLYSCTIPNNQITIKKNRAFVIGHIIKMEFFQNNELLFYQYQIIGWRDQEKILSVYNQFKELGS